jgi:gas vesicle protein
MNAHIACTQEHRDFGFAAGLLTGAVFGAGLAIWFAPRVASELRQRRDDVADAVLRGAREVERYAAAVKSDSAPDVTMHTAAGRSVHTPLAM